MSDKKRSVKAQRVIGASPNAIFDVLADPSRHAEIDGSGSVQKPKDGSPQRLALGARFGMDMKIGMPYSTKNEVVEFEEDRLIAWRHAGHHIWRYELEPVEAGTSVTETFDWATSRAPWALELMRAPERNRKAMESTLVRLAAVVED
jgi:Polyketide cyclase / dehydrase and lipid transport